ncbi:MAG: carbamoyl-phosphate synthase large subunit [Abditibacteriota bacterium]|nr:carbamoyl-phosphate synthase large subunit [Abditibacteriota bacterium]
MPKRTDIKKILIIGSGPIVIGQACEFDYSGSQACKALKEEGYEIVLVNSNPATIMTDPQMADATYIEPLTIESLEAIIAQERPDALLPTLGGQMGLNMGTFLKREGILDKYGVELLGCDEKAIAKAEDRKLFKETMESIGVRTPRSGIAESVEEGMEIIREIGFPAILRPAFTMGGAGGATAYNMEEYQKMLPKALATSPVHQTLVEESVLGWKEIEFEVMRDCEDNVIVITSMENIDPMGVHTGDSIVVAPAMSTSTEEINRLADVARKIIRAIDVRGGGTNVQFGLNPDNGEMVIIEINPRVSRSSALASKATGFPIARVAAKLAVGLTFDEIRNDITGKTMSDFEPSIDYIVMKVCRFAFEKFAGADPTLNTQMKAVGESMAIGRNFKEALQKGIRSLETGRYGLGADGKDLLPRSGAPRDVIKQKLGQPNADRIFYLKHAIENGFSTQEIYDLSKIDHWFIENVRQLVDLETELLKYSVDSVPFDLIKTAKEWGYSDIQLAFLLKTDEMTIRDLREKKGASATYYQVDTCSGEIEAEKPYYYSTYETLDQAYPTDNKKKVIILGGGPNRIGQGIEFDYCCVHASYALKEQGYESIIINCNPETVSTDFDTSDKLYFEPLTREDVLNIVEIEKPAGVIVQLGGQTPLNLSLALKKAGVRILGTSPESIDRAEDRELFAEMLRKLGLRQTENGIAVNIEEAIEAAHKVGYPVLVRPSYVLGGRAMEIVYDDETLTNYMKSAVVASPEKPVLIDKFLDDAIEIDVDAISDGETTLVCGVMEHIEYAGVHSGDSACSIPAWTLKRYIVDEIKRQTHLLAEELNVRGLMNIQFAVKGDDIYILEVNPRASRTVPFVSKATGVQWAKVATRIMLGVSLKEQGITSEVTPEHVCIKEAVFPFVKFSGVDCMLGPEMKSTGEVMGIDQNFGVAYLKAQIAAGNRIPEKGTAFLSLAHKDQKHAEYIASKLQSLGFTIYATKGTARELAAAGIDGIKTVSKIGNGRPDPTDLIINNQVDLIINTPSGRKPKSDEVQIRASAIARGIPIITTVAAARATLIGLETARHQQTTVRSIQKYLGL